MPKHPNRQTQANPTDLLDNALAGCGRLETLAALLEAAGLGDVVEGRIVRGAGVMLTREVEEIRALIKRLPNRSRPAK